MVVGYLAVSIKGWWICVIPMGLWSYIAFLSSALAFYVLDLDRKSVE